jgi:hypothetical protein
MAIIHLHWSRKPKLVRETSRGITICGATKVPRDQLTAHLTDTTCPACLEKVRLEKATAATPASAPDRRARSTSRDKSPLHPLAAQGDAAMDRRLRPRRWRRDHSQG